MSTAEEKLHGAPQESKKECDWCRESIRIDAIKCPHCSKWRKDIQQDINKNWTWAVYGIGCALLAGVFIAIGLDTDTWREEAHSAILRISGQSGPFSLKLFLSSVLGWVVLFCIAGFVTSVVMSRRYGKSAKRKTGGGLRAI